MLRNIVTIQAVKAVSQSRQAKEIRINARSGIMRSEELAKSTSFSGQSEREQADEEELVQQSPADNITNSTQPIQPTQQTGATQNTTLQAAASQQVAQINATTTAAPGVPTPENTEYVSAELGDPSWPAHTYEATQSFWHYRVEDQSIRSRNQFNSMAR